MITSWTAFLVAGLILSQLIIMLVTVYFHRTCSHLALTLTPKAHRVGRFLSWFLIAMVPREFAAVHRKHHAKCDTKDDPHSPSNHGWYGVLFGGLFLYQKESRNQETLEKYGKGLPLDPWENFYQKNRNLGVLLFLVSLLGLLGAKGLLLWVCLMIWIPFWAAGVINGLGHHVGYRNFKTSDLSTNLSPFGLWIGGEELHNNHHAYPSNPKFSQKWWEVDIGWGVILLLQKMNIASLRSTRKSDDKSVASFLSDKYKWAENFRQSIDLDLKNQQIKSLILGVPEKYRKWSKISDVFLQNEKSKLSEKQKHLTKHLSECDLVMSIFKLEKDFMSFWDERNSMTRERVLAWKKSAESLGLPSLALFASSVPEPAARAL